MHVPERLYIGTYTGAKSKGIQVLTLDTATGQFSASELAGESENPSSVAVSPDRRFLFAVNEMSNVDGKGSGGVSAFSVDGGSGKLTFLNQQSAGGSGPCFVSVDAAGKHIFVANYGSGSVEVLPVASDGKLSEPTAFVQHKDEASAAKPRQPHAHWAATDPTGKYVLACDLGLDRVYVDRYDAEKGTLTPADPPAANVADGSGPRHLVFSRDGRYAYVICELKSTVIAFEWNSGEGKLKEIQTISSMPPGYEGKTASAEIRLHPSGKFLYASNRGNDTIAVFDIDPQSGKLTSKGNIACGGKTPRGFNIDPSGQWLVVGNQGADNLLSFKIDANTGMLTETSHTDVGVPVDVLFEGTK